MTAYDFVLPFRTVSTLNRREHWAVRAKRNKAERSAAGLMCPHFPLPCTVDLIRVSPRGLDDDNLRGALKAVRDGVADKLGVDDRDARVCWRYNQERGPYGVRVELRAVGP